MNQKSRSTWWIAAIIIGLGGSLALPMIFGQAFTFRDQAFLGNNVAAAAGGGSWSTNNLTLHLIADDLTGVANNTSPVVWTNRVAGRLSFTNAVAPGCIKSNSVFNGHAALFFDGVDDVLQSVAATNWNAYVATESGSIYMVIRQRGTKTDNSILSWTSGADRVAVWATWHDNFLLDWPNGGAGEVLKAQPAGWDDAVHVLSVIRTTGSTTFYVDGTIVGTAGTPTGTLTETGNTVWSIGNGFGDFFNGDLAEIRIFNVAHTTERALNEANLKATYGTP